MNDQEKSTINLDESENAENLNTTSDEDTAAKPKAPRKPRKKKTAAPPEDCDNGSIPEAVNAQDVPFEEFVEKIVTKEDTGENQSSETSLSDETEQAAQIQCTEDIQIIENSEELSSNAAIAATESIADESNELPGAACEYETVTENASIEKDGIEYPEDDEEDEVILPPDEIFSVPTRKKVEISHYESDDTQYVDDDGQYRFAAIDEPTPIGDEDEEEIELDYSEPKLEKYNEKKPRRIDGKFDFIELFVFTFLAVVIVTSFLFKHSIVDGSSMEQTLSSGEHLIISDLFYTPKRGDIIVCEDYTTALRKPIVKRVIAVEGDRVTITADGIIYVNDEILIEDYVFIDAEEYRYNEINNFVVEKDRLFVMGDHRNKSTDSRALGTVSEDSVLGKVILRFYPFDKFGTVK